MTSPLGLGHYRTGQWDQALKVLAPYPKASEYPYVMALAIRAMTQHQQNQPEAARQTLQQSARGHGTIRQAGPR